MVGCEVETSTLPAWESVLAVVAHPDDESFGLGALLSGFAQTANTSVLCFTHGEASTLHGTAGELAVIRQRELHAAAEALGVKPVVLLDYPDGELANLPTLRLARDVTALARTLSADAIVVFDESGVTGHPDHQAATAAAVEAAERLDLPVLAWTIPTVVANRLNAEYGATFSGHTPDAIDLTVPVDRTRQRDAIKCHASQAVPSSALWRRLELLGSHEHVRWLRMADRHTS